MMSSEFNSGNVYYTLSRIAYCLFTLRFSVCFYEELILDSTPCPNQYVTKNIYNNNHISNFTDRFFFDWCLV